MCFFFFQAEDGIRDFHVTGVQTCALPISNSPKTASSALPRSPGRSTRRPRTSVPVACTPCSNACSRKSRSAPAIWPVSRMANRSVSTPTTSTATSANWHRTKTCRAIFCKSGSTTLSPVAGVILQKRLGGIPLQPRSSRIDPLLQDGAITHLSLTPETITETSHAHPQRDQTAQGVENAGTALWRPELPAERRVPASAFPLGRSAGPWPADPADRQTQCRPRTHRAGRQLCTETVLRRRP